MHSKNYTKRLASAHYLVLCIIQAPLPTEQIPRCRLVGLKGSIVQRITEAAYTQATLTHISLNVSCRPLNVFRFFP